MDAVTAAALNRINQRFYLRHAGAFSETRSRAWPGWRRVVAAFLDRSGDLAGRSAPAILDVGCGNGRFERFFSASYGRRFDYLGLDASGPLLDVAARRFRPAGVGGRAFRQIDLVQGELPSLLDERTFDLIVVFGLLHHLPGLSRRRRLLSALATHLSPGGLMALSFWQFGAAARFSRRVIAWEDHNRMSEERIDPARLEPGDILLAWGPTADPGVQAGAGPRRYCHFADPDEAGRLVSMLRLREVGRFFSDGRSHDLNLYYLLEGKG